jgi:hypothetical protein
MSAVLITASGRPVAPADAEGRIIVLVVHDANRRRPALLPMCCACALDYLARSNPGKEPRAIVQTPSASRGRRCSCGWVAP